MSCSPADHFDDAIELPALTLEEGAALGALAERLQEPIEQLAMALHQVLVDRLNGIDTGSQPSGVAMIVVGAMLGATFAHIPPDHWQRHLRALVLFANLQAQQVRERITPTVTAEGHA